MSDQFKNENQIVKTAAQASGKLKKSRQQQQSSGQSQHQQGDTSGIVHRREHAPSVEL